MIFSPLVLYALIAAIAASIVSGVIGSYVVVKRIAFISGSIAHSVLGGMGFCLWLERSRSVTWISPIHGALVAALLSAMIIGWVRLRYREREDSIIACVWSVGMATGIIFISQTPGFNVELTNYLIGNILWVSTKDLIVLVTLNIVVLTIVFCLHNKLLALSFDEEHAKLQGIQTDKLYFLLLALIAITVVLLVQVVGIVLVITMLTIPPAIANLISGRLSHIMILAAILNIFFCISGIIIAYGLDWPTGGTIALLTGVTYLLMTAVRHSKKTMT